jgi:hypothetical protein
MNVMFAAFAAGQHENLKDSSLPNADGRERQHPGSLASKSIF